MNDEEESQSCTCVLKKQQQQLSKKHIFVLSFLHVGAAEAMCIETGLQKVVHCIQFSSARSIQCRVSGDLSPCKSSRFNNVIKNTV